VDGKANTFVILPQQQIEQLLKLLLQLSKHAEDSEEEYEDFVGNTFCSYVSIRIDAWILDTSAADHMSPEYKYFISPNQSKQKPHINMPDGSTISIAHVGHIKLANGIQ